jgi:2-polyprenyl-6-methoxyphenol hydroxylase-like FAD-dependent oxidoreductase
MRVVVLGGGPAGLYFAYLWKKRHRNAQVEVFEQNPADVTWGFGVVFSERALDFLGADDAETTSVITPRIQNWREMTVVLNGKRVIIDGVGFSAIGRLELLQLLQAQAQSVGVELRFSTSCTSIAELGQADLIVGADGINSVVRRSFETQFKASLRWGSNKFIWYGTPRPFETLTQTFVDTERGAFTAHHYRYAPSASTFLIECTGATWERYGFATMNADDTKRTAEAIFSAALDGHPLVSNKSTWRNFPWVWNNQWHAGNKVLIGDALHTAHFSIGSGTRLALEDAVALVKALEAEPNLEGALGRYEAERRPIVETLVSAAKASADWYERFPDQMRLDPLEFAHSYIGRSGRIDDARLRNMSPAFMARYDAARMLGGRS